MGQTPRDLSPAPGADRAEGSPGRIWMESAVPTTRFVSFLGMTEVRRSSGVESGQMSKQYQLS